MPVGTKKSYTAKTGELSKEWFHVDATDRVLGRMAVKVATILMGKHKPTYTPHVDTGDFVVVTNVDKMKVTGRKMEQKTYDWFTGYPSGRKVRSMEDMFAKHPDRVLRLAVRRMLPKNALAKQMLRKLKVYAGGEHPHQAQQPKSLTL